MLVNNFVVSRPRIDMFRGIAKSTFEALFFLPAGEVIAPEFDDNSPLVVGFLSDRVVIHIYIIICGECQSARVSF